MSGPNDAARKWTDGELQSLERRMAREYKQAAEEMRGKQADWLKKFNSEREQREKALDNTKEAMEAHKRWLQSQAARSDWFDGMVEELSERAVRANEAAMAMLNDSMPRIYAENANMAAFAVDHALKLDTAFTLVSEDAVRILMGAAESDSPIILERAELARRRRERGIPEPRRMDRAKDMRWNRQKFTSAITQGILQGESIPNIVKRTESVFWSNTSAAIRAARTAVTAVENAGRLLSFRRAVEKGVDMEQEWIATMDERTRIGHRELDGQRKPVGEPFENSLGKIMFPGDPAAEAANVYNCRCSLGGEVNGLNRERPARWDYLPPDVTYEEWKAGKNTEIEDFRGYTYAELMERRRNG